MGFSQFTKIIGRGPTLSRPLTRPEAMEAMSMVLAGEAEPEALGGFLLVLRQPSMNTAALQTQKSLTLGVKGFVFSCGGRIYSSSYHSQAHIIISHKIDLHLNYLWISVATRAERKRHTVHLTNLDVLPRCLSPEFYRRVISVTPLLPRPDVVAHAWVIE